MDPRLRLYITAKAISCLKSAAWKQQQRRCGSADERRPSVPTPGHPLRRRDRMARARGRGAGRRGARPGGGAVSRASRARGHSPLHPGRHHGLDLRGALPVLSDVPRLGGGSSTPSWPSWAGWSSSLPASGTGCFRSSSGFTTTGGPAHGYGRRPSWFIGARRGPHSACSRRASLDWCSEALWVRRCGPVRARASSWRGACWWRGSTRSSFAAGTPCRRARGRPPVRPSPPAGSGVPAARRPGSRSPPAPARPASAR